MSWKWLQPKWRIEAFDPWSGEPLNGAVHQWVFYWKSAAEIKASHLTALARLIGSTHEYRVVRND